MKQQWKYRLWSASNNNWWFKTFLRCTILHPHLPPRFTQLSWLFGSHGSFVANKCVVICNTETQWKDCDEARIRTRQLQRVETLEIPRPQHDHWNTGAKEDQSWTPMGQETDKCPAPTNQIVGRGSDPMIALCWSYHRVWAPTCRRAIKRPAQFLTTKHVNCRITSTL